MNENRLQRLVEEILAHGLDGLALMPGPNMVYVSGIHAHIMERPTLLFIPLMIRRRSSSRPWKR